jgi:small-conductance mechanosensitive channel
MTKSLKIRFLALLVGALVACSSHAQDAPESVAPEAPDLKSLASNWWSPFERPGDDGAAKVERFLADIRSQIAGLQKPNQPIAQSALDAISDNMSAYLALLKEPEWNPQALSDPEPKYSIDQLLAIAADARAADVSAVEDQTKVDREKRILDGASRRRDLAFKEYVNSATGDGRVLSALNLIQYRSAQAISARRLEVLTERYQRSAAYASAVNERVEYALERLTTTPEEAGLFKLIKKVEEQEAVVANSQERLRAAQLAATGLDLDTELDRLNQQLHQQELVDAAVSLALQEVTLAEVQARRWWTALVIAAAPDVGELQDDALQWTALLQRIEENKADWRRDTQAELLAVQTVTQDGLNRQARRLLDQRLGTAQDTLNRIGELGDRAADLELVSRAVDTALAEYTGAFRSWLTTVSRNLKTVSQRVARLGDVTLFSIGEAPVTGGDILRVLIILLIAFLLSRAMRVGMRRVSRSEDAGTQASLYTVARLTHYAIVIIAMLIALSSIGLDFSNLAIVAGALGVGIGFGLQSIVSNFVSGLIILFEHSLRVGDYIELDTGLTGTVKAINVRSTLINTNDNIDIVVPNSEFVTTRLTNWTLGERVLRVRIPFGVAYGSDKDLVKKAALEAAANVSYTLTHMKGREPDVWLVNFGDSSLDFLLLVWVNRQGAKRPTRTRAAYLWQLETKFKEYGIEIPFPQRDLNLGRGWRESKQALQNLVDDSESVPKT